MPGADNRNDITRRLMAALQEDEFVLYSQPILACVEQQDEGRALNEIFVRFGAEDAQLLPPGAFFPVLEEAGMLPLLDRWVVNRLARHVRAGLKIDPSWEVPCFMINLSDETLADDQFPEYVLQYADDSYLGFGVLGFDVSCKSAVAHARSLQRLMAGLRPHGCSLAVADFDGSDEALARIRDLGPEFIKISAAAIDPARVSDVNRKCHELGAQTIAEYVEDRDVLHHLRRCRIDFAQGFELARAEPL
jgi:EAL domain-containing protein (putative c-di-GMP-specific phosphodiesterase class I)